MHITSEKNDTRILFSPTYENALLEISKTALHNNSAFYKNIIGSHNILAAVIKGNGYGHGLHEIAQICQVDTNIDWLCVAHVHEALFLRTHAITKPILVLGYAHHHIEMAVDRTITFMIDTIAYAKNINDIGLRYKCRFDVHIKVDTGLSRLGVTPTELLQFIDQVARLPYINITGIYSHFAASDSNSSFTQQQFDSFVDAITTLSQHAITIPFIHMSNSASLENVTYSSAFNFYRVGLGLYGISSTTVPQLMQALTWKTYIANIKVVPANSYVSYALEYKTTRTTRVAILPVGYSDGYNLRLSNNMVVRINGSYAPIIGRIAMNMMMVDVTDITASVYDEVILLGNYPHITTKDFIKQGHFINPREFLTGLTMHTKRVIVE